MSDPTKANIYWPFNQIDKIIDVVTDTVTIAAPASSGSGTTTLTKNYAHGFGDSAYFQGVFTSDTATYNDFGAQTPRLTTPGEPVLQTLDCNANVSVTNLNVTLTDYYDFVNSVGVGYTVTYKVYLLAKNTMAVPVQPLTTGSKAQFDSRYNYQKIFKQDTIALIVAAGATGSVSVTHGLGYIPKVRAFWFNSGSSICHPINYSPQLGDSGGIDSIQVEITSTTLTFFSDQSSFLSLGINGTVEYRIYYES